MSFTDRSKRILILGLILFSLMSRLVLFRHNIWRLSVDVDDYLRLAENIANWKVFGSYDRQTAFRPPLYPLMLAPIYWVESSLGLAWGWRVSAIAILHIGIGAATTVLTFRLAARCGLDVWSLVAAGLVAIDPLLLHHARAAMTETAAAFFVVAALYLMVRSDRRTESLATVGAGIVLGLGFLCRTPIWAFGASAILLGGLSRRSDGGRSWRWAAMVMGIALAVQVPWCVRNWMTFRHFIPTTTHGGYTLLLGNNDTYYDQVIDSAPFSAWSKDQLERWQSEINLRAALDGVRTEPERDVYFYEMARRTIASRPSDFVIAVLVRLASFWRVTPHSSDDYGSTVRIACAAFYIPEFVCLLIALAIGRAWQWPYTPIVGAIIGFTAVHTVYWSDMRMRAPITPAIAVLAALGASRVWDALRSARH